MCPRADLINMLSARQMLLRQSPRVAASVTLLRDVTDIYDFPEG